MRKLIVLGVVGLIAQLIDGSLGMAYGVTSSTLLLAAGVAPAAASAAVHFSEIGTSLVSGASHHKLGNVDWRTVSILAVPGFVGAFLGATLLSHLDAAVAKPVVAVILLSLGFYVVYRFLRLGGARPVDLLLGDRRPLGRLADALDRVGDAPLEGPDTLRFGEIEIIERHSLGPDLGVAGRGVGGRCDGRGDRQHQGHAEGSNGLGVKSQHSELTF